MKKKKRNYINCPICGLPTKHGKLKAHKIAHHGEISSNTQSQKNKTKNNSKSIKRFKTTKMIGLGKNSKSHKWDVVE